MWWLDGLVWWALLWLGSELLVLLATSSHTFSGPRSRPGRPWFLMTASTYRNAPLLLNLEYDSRTRKFCLGSTWCNLGLWSDSAPTFAKAAEALALKLGSAAQLAAGEAVLDVGVGYGDSTQLWATRFRTSRVVGVEISEAQVRAGRERLVPGAKVELIVGSATALPGTAIAGAPFDAVLSLDCAYHFRSRATFVRHVASLLADGGRYAAIDILPSPASDGGASWRPRLHRSLQRLVALMVDIPAANLHDSAEYATVLGEAGFGDVRFEHISHMVFEPFSRNAHRQRLRLGSELSFGERVFLWAIAFIMGLIAHLRLFDVVVVTAKRTSMNSRHAPTAHG